MPASAEHAHQRPLLALALRGGASVALATLFALVKYAGEGGIAVPELIFWCQFVSVPMILAYLAATGGLHRLRTRRLGRHGVRGGLGTFNTVINFNAALLLPLAVLMTLAFTSPLFSVVIAALVFREHIGPYRWAAVALGFVGTLVIIQPGGNHEPLPLLGLALGLTTAFLSAVVNFQVRELGRTEEAISTVFWFALIGSALMAPTLPFYATAHTPWQWFILLSIGVMSIIGQFLIAASLRHGSVALVVVMDYTLLIWATLWGWLIWDRLPPTSTFLGAPLIVAAGLTIAWREHRLHRLSATPAQAPTPSPAPLTRNMSPAPELGRRAAGTPARLHCHRE